MTTPQIFYKAPTYNLDMKVWGYTDFETRISVVSYLDSHFKYPGKYGLKYTEGFWNEQGKYWQLHGKYPSFRKGTTAFIKHWDFEKEKSKFDGFIIYKSEKEGLEYVVPGLFYFYLNYCPILDKVKKKNDLPEIYDGDLHYFLYILRCIYKRKYGCVLKKRQAGYTLKNMAIILNCIWFGQNAIAKIFAYLESKVKDSWGFMTSYKEHINRYCGWKRGLDPSGPLNWQIRRKRNDGSFAGNMSIAKGFTTKQDPTNGVGGSADVIFGEEYGINPTGDITHEYITSNVSLGGLTTGLIIYSGAVGELDKCEPLKNFILKPEENDFLACTNEIEDDAEFGPLVGFFAAEWWNYISVERDENDNAVGEAMKCFDEWGNSNKELALSEITRWRKKAELKRPESYRYYCSQRPLSIKEAFAFRKDSKFPVHLIQKQMQRINDNAYPIQYVDLERNDEGKIEFVRSNKLPIQKFPFSADEKNKEGVVCIVEKPIEKPKLGEHYYASVDPVGEGKVTTSDSLCAIYIWKRAVEVTKVENGETTVYIEPGKIVAWWCGRFDNIDNTHERLELLIEAYNAWTIVENNISLFIQYMKMKKKQRFLVPKNQIAFLKELNTNENVFQDYGWKNTGDTFKRHMLSYGIEFLSEHIDEETKPDGEIVKVVLGVERIPDIMLLKEMAAYYEGLNVDRLVAFCALSTFIKIQEASRGFVKRTEVTGVQNTTDPDIYKKHQAFFKNIGSNGVTVSNQYKIKKPMFKNLG